MWEGLRCAEPFLLPHIPIAEVKGPASTLYHSDQSGQEEERGARLTGLRLASPEL